MTASWCRPAAPRRTTLWLFTNGTDTFVPVAQVAEVWAAEEFHETS